MTEFKEKRLVPEEQLAKTIKDLLKRPRIDYGDVLLVVNRRGKARIDS